MKIIDAKTIVTTLLTLLVLTGVFMLQKSYALVENTPSIVSFKRSNIEDNALKVEVKSNNTGSDFFLELLNITKGTRVNVAGSTTSYTFQNLINGKEYEVMVRACSLSNNKYKCTDYSPGVKAIAGEKDQAPEVKTPVLSSLTPSANSIRLNYTVSGNVTGIEIVNETNKKPYKTTNKSTFTETGLKAGTTYKYKIRAYYTVNNQTYPSSYTGVKSVTTKKVVKTYTVTYKANGGKGTMAKQKIQSGVSTKLNSNKFKREGYTFAGWAIASKRGTNDKKNHRSGNNVNMKHYQIGVVKYKNKQAVKDLIKKGSITLYAVWKGSGPQAACDWAYRTAYDNSFVYGTSSASHHNGCYYCGGQGKKIKHAKRLGVKVPSGKTWYKTYCCNPFVHASYAHGTNHKKMLKACGKNGGGMSNASWTRFNSSDGKFKAMGVLSLSKLKKGDILWKNNHVRLYCGNKKIVEASGEGWGSNTIRVSSISSNSYHVVRPYGF